MAIRVVFLAALLCTVAVSAQEWEEDENVLVLTDDNLDDAIKEFDPLLVEFYAPWCGHCKRLAPEYASAAAALKKDNLRIAKVDATENSASASKYGVQGYPTLKFFKGGKPVEYNGGRTETEIVNWVRKKSGPPAKTLENAEEHRAFVNSKTDDAPVVVGYFKDLESEEAKRFLTVAGETDDVPFAVTSSPDAFSAAELSDSDTKAIVMYKNFDDLVSKFDGLVFSYRGMRDWIATESLPRIIEFTQKAAPKIFGGPIKRHVLLFLDLDDASADDLKAEYKKVAEAKKGQALFIYVAADNERVMGYFDISQDDLPAAVMVEMPEGGAMRKFRMDAKPSEEALTAFVDDFLAGKLKPFLKSEEIPENNDGPVKVVVGKSFEAIALDPEKDVLLEFYAPWCGHCKKLAPDYEKLGEKFAGIDSVVIAKMDATANEIDHPDVEVRGFPTIKLFPAGEDQKPIDFEGSRDLKGFVAFLKEHATTPFALADDDAGVDGSEL